MTRSATIVISDWLANCRAGQWTPFEAATALKEALRKEGYAITAQADAPSGGTTCCKGLAQSWECRCELERKAAGFPPYSRGELPQSPNDEDPYITDLKFANEQNIKAARKYKARLEFMEAKYGAIDWDASDTRPDRGGEV